MDELWKAGIIDILSQQEWPLRLAAIFGQVRDRESSRIIQTTWTPVDQPHDPMQELFKRGTE